MPRDEAELIASLANEPSPEAQEVPVYDPDWVPDLNPTQRVIYDSGAKFILAYGERGSGKSVGALHKLCKHCWDNFNALAVVIVGVKRQAMEGGAWFKLETDILPQWKAGLGMSWTDTKTNVAKDAFIFVSNRWGGWSRILLMSMPVGAFVKDRIKGLEPSFVLVDEVQTLDGPEYFNSVIQQLGRRPNIETTQPYVATCNPLGPSSWQYKRFFISPKDEKGEWNSKYLTVHVPIVENLHRLPPGYYEDNVISAVENDPIEYKRMVLGEWIDRPSGEAIFKHYWSPTLHIRGNANDGTRILPKPGYPLVLGYDLGTANSAISFMQNIPTKEKDLWLVFDEMVYTDAYIPYPALVPEIMRRLNFWNDTCKTEFDASHISDATAFNMYRATHGTYDALEVERLSKDAAKLYPKVTPIRLMECPKFAGSVPGRVRCVMKLLQQDRLLISASCLRTKDMFDQLESEKMNEAKKYSPELPLHPKRSKHLHIFDAMSYGLFFFELGAKAMDKSRKAEMFFMGHQ